MITSIDHKIRIKLLLTMEEYCVLDFLCDRKELTKYSDYENNLGINKGQVGVILASLKKKQMIQQRASGEIVVCDLWKNQFKKIDFIDILWNIHMAGSKQKARQRLPAVLKKIGLDELKKKLEQYVKACNDSGSYAKNLDAYLNPKSEHWNDPIPVKRDFNKQVGPSPKATEVKYIIK